jgi:hypothetical protein
LKNLKFSLPLYPDLESTYIEEDLIPFLIQNKNNIYDIYFTTRMAPFDQDAMGTLFEPEDIMSMISNALIIQQTTGITVSAVFNNKFISPSKENLDLFVKNFRMLYNAGIRSCTLPFTSWMMFGVIQKEFPELIVKNTVLDALDEPRQVYDAFMAGYEYVNLDRNLMRNQNKLKEIDEARKVAEVKLNKKLYLSLLWNENCIGNCPIQEEHYLYNSHNNKETQPDVFFKSSLACISCVEWEKQDPSYKFKKSNILPREDFLSGLYMIDVFKLHGRESHNVFLNSVGIIDSIANGVELHDEFHMLKDKLNITDEKFQKWIDVTKNCNFDCWKCSECDDLTR